MKVSMKTIIFIALIWNVFAFGAESDFSKQKAAAIHLFKEDLKQISRVDGDGLIPRKNRKKTWQQVTAQLKRELDSAKTKKEIGRVFKRLDAAYTNLHAHIALNPEFDFRSEGKLTIAAAFHPEEIAQDGSVKKYLIASVKEEYFVRTEPENRPQVGDELIAINGKPMKVWSDENFEFGKFPYRSQCENNFFDNLRGEVLSWSRRIPLSYTLKRNGKKLDVFIPVVAQTKNPHQKDEKPESCVAEPVRYPDFELVHQGYNACVYERKDSPNVALLRIRSFRYHEVKGKIEIDSIRKETKAFAEKYWNNKSRSTKTLIIDLVQNGGGEEVISWDVHFLDQPFQDQWVQFRNITELNDEKFRKAAFYDEPGKERIYQAFEKPIKGEFLSPMPQFCKSEEGDCLKEKYTPIDHGFKGKVIVLTDEWCISSCTGFAWTLKNYLKDRAVFAGLPESGDSTYWRVFIEGKQTNEKPGYQIQVLPRVTYQKAEVSGDAIFREAVTSSRSTDENGVVVSGVPMKVDYFSAPRWNEDTADWIGRLLKELKEKNFY